MNDTDDADRRQSIANHPAGKGRPAVHPVDLTPEERAIVAHALQVYAVDVRNGLGSIAKGPTIRALHARMIHGDYGRCIHPGLLPSMDAPHPKRDREAYEAWLDRTKRCGSCGSMVPERDL